MLLFIANGRSMIIEQASWLSTNIREFLLWYYCKLSTHTNYHNNTITNDFQVLDRLPYLPAQREPFTFTRALRVLTRSSTNPNDTEANAAGK